MNGIIDFLNDTIRVNAYIVPEASLLKQIGLGISQVVCATVMAIGGFFLFDGAVALGESFIR